jgi:hypothetical protein
VPNPIKFVGSFSGIKFFSEYYAKVIYPTNIVSLSVYFGCETFRTSRPKQEILGNGDENPVLNEKKWLLRRNKMKTHTFAPSFYLKAI